MESEGAAKTIARWVALLALFLIPFTPLIVANGYFFPFITGKAFYFRILVEIAVAAWAVLAALDKAYRPRFSWIGAAVLGFVVWMFVADLFALNVAKAMWSNFERMEGWVLLIHLLGLFYAAGAVLRVEKKWRAWFLTSLLVSIYISGYAALQALAVSLDAFVLALPTATQAYIHAHPVLFYIYSDRNLYDFVAKFITHQGSVRVDATLGNSAYLAIYFLFNVFIAMWLALTEKYTWLKWTLIALAAFEGVLIFFTETRGTVIGLVLGLALAALLATITAGKRARRYAAGAFLGIVVLSGVFYINRNSDFVQNNHVLQRIASISPGDGQTRFTIWHMALQGALEKPLTGWGQEGFNYVFNKYYDPSLYHQESWFDRAHNAFIDWLSAGGIPAFLLYLSLFGTAIFLLWKSSELSRPERIALTAALVGYAVHNLFVFDNLYSYVYFFAILALIDSQVGRPIERFESVPELDATEGLAYSVPIATVVAVAVIWYVNVTGMKVTTDLITAMSPQMSVQVFEIAATNVWPDVPETHRTLAAAYYATGRPADAVAQLKEAEKVAPTGALGDAVKAQIETLIGEVTQIGTGRGVPQHIAYFENAIATTRKKAVELRTQVASQLRIAEKSQNSASSTDSAVLKASVPNLKAEISALDTLAGSASDELLQEMIKDAPKGLLRNLDDFKNLLAGSPFAAQEIREQLVSFATSVAQNPDATKDEKQAFVALAVSEMNKQVTSYPQDARGHLELSYAYRAAGDGENARKETLAASALSPKKEEMWIALGATEWDLGNIAAAQKDFNTAYALGPEFPDLAAYAAAGDFAVGDAAAADKLLLGAFGTTTVDNDILGVAYYRSKQWPRLIALWKMRVNKDGAPASAWFSLASAYYQAGDKANAIKSIDTAVALDPSAAATGAAAIKQIRSGQ